jgi:hypothetical protein
VETEVAGETRNASSSKGIVTGGIRSESGVLGRRCILGYLRRVRQGSLFSHQAAMVSQSDDF